jgi:hypothetical protein
MSCGAAAMSCGAAAMNCDAAAMPGIVAVMSLHPMQMRLCLVRKTTGVAAGVVRQSVTLSSRLKSIQPGGFSTEGRTWVCLPSLAQKTRPGDFLKS